MDDPPRPFVVITTRVILTKISQTPLRASNNQIITTSGEGYANRTDCLTAIDLVKSSQDAPV